MPLRPGVTWQGANGGGSVRVGVSWRVADGRPRLFQLSLQPRSAEVWYVSPSSSAYMMFSFLFSAI